MAARAPFKLDPLTLTLALVGALTALRVLAIFVTPLELYPDEAQYWVWSRELAWGYYSKPPMVGWLIAASTAIGGDGEAWVRLPATLIQGGAALALFGAGASLYDRWTGFWAAAVYSLMPGVQLSSLVMSTDAPLLLLLGLALWLYARLWRGASGNRLLTAGALGAVVGLAFLSKYAAVYFVGGLLLHALLSGEARRAWSGRAASVAALMFGLVMAPNLAWNATHDFATVSHTAAETNWDDPELFSVLELARFIGEQFGVFGPAPFAILLVGAVALMVRKRLREPDAGLLLFSAIPLAAVSVQAFISGANANWGAAAYAPASVLVGAWLVRWRARRLATLTVALQGGLGLLFLATVMNVALADRLGLANSFKRARGWTATTAAVTQEMARSPGWSAVAVDNRFLFNAMAYYGRDVFGRPGTPPLTIWLRKATAQNQAETTAPLTPALAGRVLVTSIVPEYRPAIRRDFAAWRPLRSVGAPMGGGRVRDVAFYEASGYRRAPRDPVTGLPTRP